MIHAHPSLMLQTASKPLSVTLPSDVNLTCMNPVVDVCSVPSCVLPECSSISSTSTGLQDES